MTTGISNVVDKWIIHTIIHARGKTVAYSEIAMSERRWCGNVTWVVCKVDLSALLNASRGNVTWVACKVDSSALLNASRGNLSHPGCERHANYRAPQFEFVTANSKYSQGSPGSSGSWRLILLLEAVYHGAKVEISQ